MRDLLSWNLSLGRWWGVQVRLHALFLLFIVVALHLSSGHNLVWFGATSIGLLFVSVLLHEFGHCFAAWKVGGTADQVILWPLGGLAHPPATREPQDELVTSLAGPLVNLSVCGICVPALLWLKIPVLPLLNMLTPPVGASAELGVADVVGLTFWINWLLVVVNLVPAYPLDGGRLLRSMLWVRFGYRTAVLYVAFVAKLVAVALLISAWLVHKHYSFASLPLALFGILLYFSARQEAERLQEHEHDDAPFGYDFSQGYTSLEKHFEPPERTGGPLRQWIDRRRAQREMRQRQTEEDDERRVDDVLARLHALGRSGLTPDDRALLDRVSARYRNRPRSS